MSRLSTLRTFYRIGYRKRPIAASSYVGLIALDVASIAAFGLALRTFIDSGLHHHTAAAAVAAVTAGACWAVASASTLLRANLGFLLAETVSIDLNSEILHLVGGVDDLTILEDPDYANRVDVLRRGGDALGRSAWQVLESVAIALRMVVIVTVLALVAVWLAALLVPLAVAIWCQRRGQTHIRKSTMDTAQDTRLAEHLFTMLTQPSSGMEVRIAGAGDALRERQRQTWARATQIQTRAHRLAARITTVGWTVFAVGYTFVLLRVVTTTGVGDAMLTVTLLTILRKDAEITVWRIRSIVESNHLIDVYLWLIRRETVQPDINGHLTDRLRRGILLQGVGFRYRGAESVVFSSIDLAIPAGTTLAIVGEHGVGKTTLVKLLCGLYEPIHGVITVDDVALHEKSRRAWRERVTGGFQDFARFAFTVRESVGVGDLPNLHDDKRIELALEYGDAAAVVRTLPEKLDTQLGTEFGGADLSRGQWQRLALSRAYMRTDPLLCVLDEPTASLDARSEHLVYERQLGLARELSHRSGTVTVLVSHRFSTVRAADQIIVLADGGITERGTHDELLARDGHYARMYRLQADSYADRV
ncbi:ATP-binding cassette domain-containing protein [Nocardia sp. NPDC060249]|uniref:ATP-binding cassette domain-containing protein n=1 Tax=Nocardia sp. NPDC060249 TaxID=3347082 RepID=UPI0036635CE6